MGVGQVHGDHGVGQNKKVGARTGALNRVGGSGVAGVEVRSGGGGKVTSGREAHDPDPVRRNSELGGAGADGSDGPLRILERGGMVVARAEPVLQHEGRHAEFVEPLAHLYALVTHREVAVGAAGTHDDGGRGGRRDHDRQFGAVQVLIAESARRSTRPQGLHLLVRGQTAHDKNHNQDGYSSDHVNPLTRRRFLFP